jgi:hypothetical protein
MNRPEIQVIIPDSLKARLIDDWEHICYKGEVSFDSVRDRRSRMSDDLTNGLKAGPSATLANRCRDSGPIRGRKREGRSGKRRKARVFARCKFFFLHGT